MKKAKIIVMFLAVAMISMIIFSCGGSNNSKTNDTTTAENGTAGSTEAATDATKSTNSIEDKPAYDLPVQNLNGYKFRVLSRSETANAHWCNIDIAAEAENGDPINDAIYIKQ